jgi:hypothetical protein
LENSGERRITGRLSIAKKGSDYQQDWQNTQNNSTKLFLFNGAPQRGFFSTCYTLIWQGIQPPVAAMTIVLGDGRGKYGE